MGRTASRRARIARPPGARRTPVPHRTGRGALLCGALLATLALAPLRAARAQQGSGAGFLFRPPTGSLSLRGGYARANAGGELFSFITDQLTLGRGDFSGFTGAADLALRVAPRLDVVLSAAYAGTSTPSEYRRLVDQNEQPIRQTTSLTRVPVTATLRLYLTPRGRSVGRFAWIPARIAPYVGAGGGAMWYRFRQAGDFVDYQDNDIFTSDIASSRWTLAAAALGGVEFSLTSRLALTGEGRYTWARARLDQSFTGFGRADLSGFSTTVGLLVRF